jgi:tRNA dimethylallyltransferase
MLALSLNIAMLLNTLDNKRISESDVIIIFGPTGSGKTDLAISLIKELKIEKNVVVISADSRQVYRGMDIGTNKDVNKFKELGIEVWGVDVLNPNESFSVFDFYTLAIKEIEEAKKKGLKVIVVGGTGLYLDSLIYEKEYIGLNREDTNKSELSYEEVKDKLEKEFKTEWDNLNESERKNLKRLRIIYERLNNSDNSYETKLLKEFVLVSPKYDREKLYNKINERVDKMIKEGLVEEVKKLIESGFSESESMKGTGYKEILKYLNNEMTLNEAIDNIKKSHRHYAKRQITWFKKYINDFNVISI